LQLEEQVEGVHSSCFPMPRMYSSEPLGLPAPSHMRTVLASQTSDNAEHQLKGEELYLFERLEALVVVEIESLHLTRDFRAGFHQTDTYSFERQE